MWYRQSGVIKLYEFNGSVKSLQDHLIDLYPNLNSVDIFYKVTSVRARAKKTGKSVSAILYEILLDSRD